MKALPVVLAALLARARSPSMTATASNPNSPCRSPEAAGSWIAEDGLGFYYVMSQFGSYNTYVMKAELAPK